MNNKKQKIKGNYYIYLPSNIIDEINNLSATKLQKERMLHFVSFLKDNSRINGGKVSDKGVEDIMTNFVSVPRTLFEKMYSAKYKDFLKPLVDKNIVEVNNSYSNFKGREKCKEYRINPRFVNDLEITKECIKSIVIQGEVEQKNTHISSFYKTCTGESIVKDLYYFLDEYNEYLSNLPIDEYILETKEEIGLEYIQFISKKGEYFSLSTEEALKKNGYVIKDKNKYFICDGAKFLKHKVKNKQISAIESVMKLINMDLYAKRNSTNNRMDTNFTNLPSAIFEKYKEVNKLVEFDVKNNQFAILAHILPKEVVGEDVELFKFLAKRGELYEYIETKLGLRSRQEAKELLICILFASYRVLDKRIKEAFPNLCEWIKKWKKENGDDGKFPTMLQQKEAEIFVDGVFKTFKKRFGCFLALKHDSVIVNEHKGEEVKKSMQEFFDKIGYECKIN